MKVTHLIVSDSFTREPHAVAVNFSETARRANTAALLREYRANGYTVRTVETGAMYRADSPHGYYVNIWYSLPNVWRVAIISDANAARVACRDKGEL
jgi:hypothetical protein